MIHDSLRGTLLELPCVIESDLRAYILRGTDIYVGHEGHKVVYFAGASWVSESLLPTTQENKPEECLPTPCSLLKQAEDSMRSGCLHCTAESSMFETRQTSAK